MYFEEGLKLDTIRDNLKDSDESIKAVIVDARQKALKILVEEELVLSYYSTPNSIKNFIQDFVEKKKGKFKQIGLNEQALQYLLTNIFELVLEKIKDKDKMDAPVKSDQFPEFRLEKLEDALSGPNQLTIQELKKLSDFIKNQVSGVRQAALALLCDFFVCGFGH
jgi:hypothetical protein